MRIEIIHGRDPDYGCDHTVFVDGEPLSDQVTVDIYTLDPGSGWERSDWEAAKNADCAQASPKVAEALAEAYDSYGESQYVDD